MQRPQNDFRKVDLEYKNEQTALKSRVTDEIYKEVIAFANTDGGVIYVGIDDQGNVVGLEDADGARARDSGELYNKKSA